MNIVNHEMKHLVLSALVHLIEAKGDRKKMISAYDVSQFLIEQGHTDYRKLIVEVTLSALVDDKAVRYFRNERKYKYFGITDSMWKKWDEKGGVA